MKERTRRLAYLFLCCAISGTFGGFLFSKFNRGEEAFVIRSVPHVIKKSGHYTLEHNLKYSAPEGIAIEIRADNVTLDLNGYALETDVPAKTGLGVGILARGKNDVVIRNGRVSGFYMGVYISDDRMKDDEPIRGFGRQVLDMQVTRSKYEAIHIEGLQSVVQHCQVRETGGYRSKNNSPVYVQGIKLFGESSIIRDNDVLDTFNWGLPNALEAVGISCAHCFATHIESNTVANRERGCFVSYGMWVSGDSFNVTHTPVFIARNRLVNLSIGLGAGHISDGFMAKNILYDTDHNFYSNPSKKFSRGKVSKVEDVAYDGLGGAAVWTDGGDNVEVTSELNSYRLRRSCKLDSIYGPWLNAEGYTDQTTKNGS